MLYTYMNNSSLCTEFLEFVYKYLVNLRINRIRVEWGSPLSNLFHVL